VRPVGRIDIAAPTTLIYLRIRPRFSPILPKILEAPHTPRFRSRESAVWLRAARQRDLETSKPPRDLREVSGENTKLPRDLREISLVLEKDDQGL